MEKIARLCWNTNEWKRPSGRKGKSTNKSSYEKEVGFGHEEWLLDDSKIMPDGYHYGFLEQLNNKSDIHYGKVYDIHLYTISPGKQRVYLGCLKNAVGVSLNESQEVYTYYQNNGWIEEMKQDVLLVEGNPRDFKPQLMFNIKFRFEDAEIKYSEQPILTKDSISTPRYLLLNKYKDIRFEKDEKGNIKYFNSKLIRHTTKGISKLNGHSSSKDDYQWDEIPNPETVYEGAKKEIFVNSYERSREARDKCIAARGCKCSVCGMDFEKMYGELGHGFIHVHHLVPISTIGKEYELDPVKDLVPVCPNCHAMLHRNNSKTLTIEELKQLLKK